MSLIRCLYQLHINMCFEIIEKFRIVPINRLRALIMLNHRNVLQRINFGNCSPNTYECFFKDGFLSIEGNSICGLSVVHPSNFQNKNIVLKIDLIDILGRICHVNSPLYGRFRHFLNVTSVVDELLKIANQIDPDDSDEDDSGLDYKTLLNMCT